MKIRFQADADVDARIVKGIRRRRPEIDFRFASGVIPDRTPDPAVLLLAAKDNRVLVSSDASTMPVHFEEFVLQHESPGIIATDSSGRPTFITSPDANRVHSALHLYKHF